MILQFYMVPAKHPFLRTNILVIQKNAEFDQKLKCPPEPLF